VDQSEPITVELNGKTVAELKPGGPWAIDWQEIRHQACNLTVPRDCWIAQLLRVAFLEGQAEAAASKDLALEYRAGYRDGFIAGQQSAQDQCPGCGHEPEPSPAPVDPRQVQQAEQQKRTLADYLSSDAVVNYGSSQMRPEQPRCAALARAILAPAVQDIGLGRRS
jgi:hypothetical protein